MKIEEVIKAYLILAHKNPDQLVRLIEALNDEQSAFFVHIDKSTTSSDFDLLKKFGQKVQLVKRIKTEWARFGLVQATINGLEAIRKSGKHFRHVILISGQDYPVKSNEFITRFCMENQDKIFIESHHLPAHEKWQPHGGLYRVNKYFFGFRPWHKFFSKAVNFLAGRLSFLQRKMYDGMEPYAGSMWWIFNGAAVEYILNFIEEHPGYIVFHQHTFAPDEVFFQTILLNARAEHISGKIVNTNKRFIQWKDQFSSHPKLLGTADFQELVDSDALFARKFEGESASPVLDQIDHFIQLTSVHEAIL